MPECARAGRAPGWVHAGFTEGQRGSWPIATHVSERAHGDTARAWPGTCREQGDHGKRRLRPAGAVPPSSHVALTLRCQVASAGYHYGAQFGTLLNGVPASCGQGSTKPKNRRSGTAKQPFARRGRGRPELEDIAGPVTVGAFGRMASTPSRPRSTRPRLILLWASLRRQPAGAAGTRGGKLRVGCAANRYMCAWLRLTG